MSYIEEMREQTRLLDALRESQVGHGQVLAEYGQALAEHGQALAEIKTGLAHITGLINELISRDR